MKDLNLATYGVAELNEQEMTEVYGGGPVGKIIAAALRFIADVVEALF